MILDSIFGSSQKKKTDQEEKIFRCKNTKYITLTFHKLPDEFDCLSELSSIQATYIANLATKKKQEVDLLNIVVTKEPYDLKKNPENKGLCHLHMLIELKQKIRINKHKHTAKLFVFSYRGQEYYPHISPCRDLESYYDYIVKLVGRNLTHNRPNYASLKRTLDYKIKIDYTVKDMRENLDIYTKQDARAKLKHHTETELLSRRQIIDFLFNKMPETREKLEHFIIEVSGLKHISQNYLKNPNYLAVKELVHHLLTETRKYSGYISGAVNTAKSSMVYAAVIELAEQLNKKYLMLKFTDLDSIKAVNQINDSIYDLIVLVIDDVTPEVDEQTHRTYLINLLTGNEQPTVLKCRYENARFNKKMVKIFTNNVPFEQFIKNMKEEYKVRVKEIQLNKDYIYFPS